MGPSVAFSRSEPAKDPASGAQQKRQPAVLARNRRTRSWAPRAAQPRAGRRTRGSGRPGRGSRGAGGRRARTWRAPSGEETERASRSFAVPTMKHFFPIPFFRSSRRRRFHWNGRDRPHHVTQENNSWIFPRSMSMTKGVPSAPSAALSTIVVSPLRVLAAD